MTKKQEKIIDRIDWIKAIIGVIVCFFILKNQLEDQLPLNSASYSTTKRR